MTEVSPPPPPLASSLLLMQLPPPPFLSPAALALSFLLFYIYVGVRARARSFMCTHIYINMYTIFFFVFFLFFFISISCAIIQPSPFFLSLFYFFIVLSLISSFLLSHFPSCLFSPSSSIFAYSTSLSSLFFLPFPLPPSAATPSIPNGVLLKEVIMHPRGGRDRSSHDPPS